MGPEMIGTPHDILEARRKEYYKEQQIKFFNKIHRKRKSKRKRR